MSLLATEPRARRWTIDEFMAMPDAKGYELVKGVLLERKPTGALSNHVAAQIIMALASFCQKHGIHVFTSDTIYRCFDDPATGRKPDISFIAAGRLPSKRIPEGYIEIPADLVVEVISPSDLAYEVEDKVALYLAHGFGEVWVVYPNRRVLHVHRKGEPIIVVEAEQPVQGNGPLAGFSCPLNSFFPAT